MAMAQLEEQIKVSFPSLCVIKNKVYITSFRDVSLNVWFCVMVINPTQAVELKLMRNTVFYSSSPSTSFPFLARRLPSLTPDPISSFILPFHLSDVTILDDIYKDGSMV